MCFVFLYLPLFSAIGHVSHGKALWKYAHYYYYYYYYYYILLLLLLLLKPLVRTEKKTSFTMVPYSEMFDTTP